MSEYLPDTSALTLNWVYIQQGLRVSTEFAVNPSYKLFGKVLSYGILNGESWAEVQLDRGDIRVYRCVDLIGYTATSADREPGVSNV